MTIDVREQHERQTMRAFGFRRYGPPDVLEMLEVPRPEPGPGEVLISVAAAGVNPADWALRAGRLRPFVRLELPFISGSDVAGVVEETGEGVTKFVPGEAVYAMTPTTTGGAYAEYVAVATDRVAKVPSGLSLEEAAAVPLAALTALQALRDKAELATGKHVLINGASGGVGTFAVQIAKTFGARVTAACSGRNVELVRGLGADEVIDYNSDDIAPAGPRYDVVFGAVNTLPLLRWRRALRPEGKIVTVNPLFENAVVAQLAGAIGRVRLEGVLVRPSGADLETVGAWISDGKVRPVIDCSYPLHDAATAHRYSESRRVRGKLVLVVDEQLAGTEAGSFSTGEVPVGRRHEESPVTPAQTTIRSEERVPVSPRQDLSYGGKKKGGRAMSAWRSHADGPALRTEGLVRRFGDNAAVDGVDLEVATGEIYGFLGPNGAGKTTTVRMLVTLLAPSAGRAWVAGCDVASDPGGVRLRIGVALQEAALDAMQTGTEILRLQGRFYGLTGAEIERRLKDLRDLIDIGDALDRFVGSYSGGMRRRLDLASALMHNPEVLFLDEPTTGLDPVSRIKVWEEVKRLNSELGVTIFLTTQYLEEADHLADRVGIIDRGRIVAEGSPAELKRSVGQDLVVISTRGGSFAMDGVVDRLRALETVERVDAHEGELTVATPDGSRVVGRVAVALEKAGIAVDGLTLRTPSLDDVFLEVTGNRMRIPEGQVAA